MAVDIRKLRYFVAVAEEGHVTRAAERLGIQQPPLSLQIKALEASLGVKLFRREARGVSLTEAGKTLLSESRPLLANLDRAVEATRSASRGEEGELRVGIAPTAPFISLVPRAIRDFRQAYPRVRLTLGEGLSNDMRERLAGGLVDAAFVRSASLGVAEVKVLPLLNEPLIVALPLGHAADQGPVADPLALATLAGEALILVGPPGTGLHDETIAACASAGFMPRTAQIAPQITSTLGLVAAGLGVALVPESIQALRMDGISYRHLVAPRRPTAFLGLAFRKDNRSPVLKHFTEAVDAVFVRAKTPLNIPEK